MERGVFFRRRSFANSLIVRIGLLILFALAVFAAGSYQLIVGPAIQNLATAQMGQVSEQLATRSQRLFETVETSLRISRDWGISQPSPFVSLQGFNDFFMPRIANHPEISSVEYAQESGREVFLLRRPDGGWINRLSDPEQWGKRSYWVYWNPARELEKVETQETDYDARTRPWFTGVLGQKADNAIHWTAPYRFFTAQVVGVTATTGWTAADGSRRVIGHDVSLADLSKFTAQLQVGTRGVAALFQADGRLIALPRDRARDPSAFLKTPRELGMHEMAAGYERWQMGGAGSDTVREYDVSGKPWFSLLRPMAIGEQKFSLGVFAPKEEFFPGTQKDLILLGLIALLALLAGVFVAFSVARQFGRPLEALAAEASRIGHMALDAPVQVHAPWRETRQLAEAQEAMRQRLKDAKASLDAANTALESKVAARTRELEESRAALQTQEEFFRAVFDHAAIGISSLTPQLQRRRVNRAFSEFTGYSIDELLAGSALDLLAPEEKARIRAAYADVARGDQASFRSEIHFICKDGEPRWADVQIAAIHDAEGQVTSLLATILDVTDRRAMESELARQFALMQALIDTIPNPIFYKGTDTRFLGCNVAYERAFGADRHRFVGKRVLDLEYLPEADRLAYQQEDEAVIASIGRAAREVTMTLADGQAHDVLYSVTGFSDGEGGPGGLIGMIVDITPLKNAQREAQQARLAAEAAAAAKADFLANMSHEIRTPMNAIVGMTHLALQTELTDRQRNYLSKVDGAAKGLLGIINDILDFSKIEAGMMRLEQADFKLDHVLGHVADLSALKAREKGLELLFDVDPDVPKRLKGDSLRLGQVLVNLVSNALKFTDRGEVTVSVSLAEAQPDDVVLRFTVSDTGIGIGEAECRNLFAAFTQADTSTTRRYGGTGLGLSICKRIVELMDGTIDVVSTPGVGSRFFFTARFGLADELPAPPLAEGPLHELRVLVADDNAAARDVFQHMLAGLGIGANAVASGEAALAELAAAEAAGKPYGLLIADWQMAGLDGVETVRRLRGTLGVNGIPAVVMTTAYDRDELVEALAGLGVTAILPKPVTISTLLDSIMQALHANRGHSLADPLAGNAASGRLSGVNVMLVEDNAVNLELAVELLETAGVRVTVAGNGAEAVELAESGKWRGDAVLMDCHMPVMDGFEATRRLRAIPATAETPIIAMTASAQAGDRERCLACGMNDHIPKPISVTELYRKLQYWTLLHRDEDEDTEPAPVADPPETAAAGVLDAAAALRRLGNNRVMYGQLLKRFSTDQATVLQRYRAAMAAGDAATARRVIHTLKGLAGNIGASDLEHRAQALVVALGAADAEVEPLVAAVDSALDEAIVSATDLAESITPPAVVPNPEHCRPLDRASLRDLHQLLLGNDAQATRLLKELRPGLEGAVGLDEVATLAKEIVSYDFDNASVRLQGIAARLGYALD